MAGNPKVLMVTAEYPPGLGGVGDYTALLCSHLVRAGARVAVLTGHPADSLGRDAAPYQPEVIRSIRGWGFASWSQVVSAAVRHRSEVIHLQYQAAAYGMHPAANLLPAFVRARLRGVKTVTTFHDLRVPYLFPKAGALRQGAIRALDGLSHATVVTNQADLDDLGGTGGNGGGPRPRRRLIPLGSNIAAVPPSGFDRASWRRSLGIDEDTLLLCYFGFMNDTKGVEFLIQALGLLARDGLKLRLIVVGGESGASDPTNQGYSQRIVQMIKSRHLVDRVTWTGFMPPEHVSASLLSSDVCALPFRDGVSLRRTSILAAFVHGLPIVTTFPERPEPLLIDGENVAMVERDSPAALASSIQHLWRDPAARQQLAAGARALSDRFRWEDVSMRHMEMYETLLASKDAQLNP